ncbi:MAG: hypothetical protein ACJZ57_03085 [Candidatus Poriferisodalaceae bacterium]|nr:MAG: hypothetical protein CNE88_08665 [Acidimicrobiales bacterium MED-G01]
MQPKKVRKLLVSGRATVGWLSVLAPSVTGKAWGINSPLSGETKYMIRLFGIRNAVLAYQLYQADRPDAEAEELEETLRQGIAIDIFDLAFILFARAPKGAKSFGRTMPALAALISIVLGVLAREKSELSEDLDG